MVLLAPFPRFAPVEMKNKVPALVVVLGLAGLCWAFPPFHLRSLKAVREAHENQQFNATDFAARFWNERLLPAAENAADAAVVLETAASSPQAVRERFGRTVGVGDSFFLFVRGSGRVVSADGNNVGLRLQGEGDQPQIVIELGFVFGNAVRDATGLISASDYPNAQEFNEIAAALNGMVETNVLPQLQQIAKVGGRIQFMGCVEVADEDLDLKPLKLVPIEVGESR
jgi:predicted lipoprotein